MKKDLILICRTMFCEKCFKKKHPEKGQQFVVYGNTRKTFHAKRVHGDIGKKQWGYCPHIILFDWPLTYKDGLVQIAVSCGVCEMKYEYTKQSIAYTFINARYIYLTEVEFHALLTKWKRTGFELL